MLIVIGLATVVSTFFGGIFAIRFKDKLHLILGFSAGAVIGVTLFDLLPESIELAGEAYGLNTVTIFMALGFVFYMVLDRLFSIHPCEDKDNHDCENPSHNGKVGALALAFHSFLDGLGIGLAFKVSPTIGWIVAAAVLAHDFSDGINTVTMILKNKGNKKEAIKWLIVDAVAPVLGVVSTLFFSVSQGMLGLILAIFTGLFLYIGASDLVPESHHHHPTFLTTAMTICGILVLYTAIHLAR